MQWFATHFFIIQKSHEINEKSLFPDGVHTQFQRNIENNHESSSANKLRYISFGMCTSLLIIGITFTITNTCALTDVITIKDKTIRKILIIEDKINAWIGIFVSEIIHFNPLTNILFLADLILDKCFFHYCHLAYLDNDYIWNSSCLFYYIII